MKQGVIIQAVKEEAKGTVAAAGFFIFVCAVIFAVSWRHVYNQLTGPVSLTKELAANLGATEFVTLSVQDNAMLPTGFTEQSTVRLKRLNLGTYTIADFKKIKLGDRFLVVKVDTEFKGDLIEGGLRTLPQGMEELSGSAQFYPVMLVKENYRLSGNLFFLLAVLVFPLSVLLLLYGMRRMAKPANARAIRSLKRFGRPDEIVAAIDAEIANLGVEIGKSPLTILPSWIIVTVPTIDILARSEIVAIGLQTTPPRPGSKKRSAHVLYFWLSKIVGDSRANISDDALPGIMRQIREQFAGLLVPDVEAFKKGWLRRCAEDMHGITTEKSQKNRMATDGATAGAPSLPPSLAGFSDELVTELAAAKYNDDCLTATIGLMKAGNQELMQGWAREFCKGSLFCLTTIKYSREPFIFGPKEDRNYIAVFTRKEFAEAAIKQMQEYGVLEDFFKIDGTSLLNLAKASQRGIWINPLHETCTLMLSPYRTETLLLMGSA